MNSKPFLLSRLAHAHQRELLAHTGFAFEIRRQSDCRKIKYVNRIVVEVDVEVNI